ncbi:universal stress protein [Noviherbaspirillum sp. ST9]|uniref:universal stress protein n=1 Tax=Noviherbaspirillum sp. ST9 TaxID=3401606 RepID=UPI003B586D69
MYTRILVPTDGSELAEFAALAGVEFAAMCDAEVVGLHVAPEYQYPVSVEIIPPSYPTEEEFREATRKTGDGYLAGLCSAAAESGLKVTAMTVHSNKPAHKIVEMAREMNCDLIFIGSHGRSGIEQLLVGSVTSKVLSLCDIPVLVYRRKKEKH